MLGEHTERRLLAYDQLESKFCFVPLYDRYKKCFHDMVGMEVEMPRYEAYKICTFKYRNSYPKFTQVHAAMEWGHKNALLSEEINQYDRRHRGGVLPDPVVKCNRERDARTRRRKSKREKVTYYDCNGAFAGAGGEMGMEWARYRESNKESDPDIIEFYL